MIDKLLKLTRQLYPTGRAFRIPKGGELEKMHKAFNESELTAYNDSVSILDSILPDNDNFTALDASQWEERLGMITNSSVSLGDRKSAIKRKMNHPGDIPARQSWDYLQDSLQLAGFNVFVYENIPEQTPQGVLLPSTGAGQQGMGQQGDFQQGSAISYYPSLFVPAQQGIQQGSFQQGGYVYTNKVANHIDEDLDKFFNFGANYKSAFFIGGPTKGSFADVDVNRKDEFRQLILKIKPVPTVAVLFINYV